MGKVNIPETSFMRKIIIALLILIILLSIPFAFALQPYNIEDFKSNYNKNLDKIPGIVKFLIGNEIINLYFTPSDGPTVVIGTKTYDAMILTLQDKPYEKPTMNIYISENTVQALIDNKMTVQEALDLKKIKYKSFRFKTKIKTGLVKPIFRVWNWFN